MSYIVNISLSVGIVPVRLPYISHEKHEFSDMILYLYMVWVYIYIFMYVF